MVCVLFALVRMVTVVSGRFVGVPVVVLLMVGLNGDIVVLLVPADIVVVTFRVGFGRDAVVGRRVTVLLCGTVVDFRVDVTVGRCVVTGFGREETNGLFVVTGAFVAIGSPSGLVMSGGNVVGRCRFVGFTVSSVVGRRVVLFVVTCGLIVVIGCSS